MIKLTCSLFPRFLENIGTPLSLPTAITITDIILPFVSYLKLKNSSHFISSKLCKKFVSFSTSTF